MYVQNMSITMLSMKASIILFIKYFTDVIHKAHCFHHLYKMKGKTSILLYFYSLYSGENIYVSVLIHEGALIFAQPESNIWLVQRRYFYT